LILVIAFAVFGALSTSRMLLGLLGTLFHVYLMPGISLKRFGAGENVWAVVTGCTDGIGKQFALQLSKARFNIVLVSRNAEKLATLTSEIESKYGVQTKQIVLNFVDPNSAGFSQLLELSTKIPIGVLINNVGTNSEIPTFFADEQEQILRDTIEVNCQGAIRVTKSIIPGMIERRNGLIINVGSGSGLVPTPLLSVYSASKAFLNTWSQALGVELSQYGIIVECLTAFFVVSNMSKIKRPSFTAPSAEDYVKCVLNKIGVAGGAMSPFTSCPYPSHAVANWAIETVPSRRMALKINYDMHMDIRKRALRRREKAAKSQ